MTEPALQLSARLDRPKLSRAHAGLVHLVVEVNASRRAVPRAPLALCLALDASGSMEGQKLEHVIASVRFLVEQLDPRDHLALVSFASSAQVLLPRCAADAQLPGRVRHALSVLRASGGTNLEAGLRLAASVLHAAPVQRRAILLLSDGQPTSGALTPHELAGLARSLDGTALSTLGYGEDHSEEVLAALAEAGRGTYAYLPSPEQCRVELARAVGAQTAIIADQVQLSFTAALGVDVERVIGAPSPARAGPEGFELKLPDLWAGAGQRVAVALRVAATGHEPVALGQLSLSYRDAERPACERVTVTAGLGDGAAPLDAVVHASRLICSATEARRAAGRLAAQGQFDAGRLELQQVIDEIRAAPSAAARPDLLEVLEQLIDDVALLAQRPNEAALKAYRRGQTHARPTGSALLTAAYGPLPRGRLVLVSRHGPPREVSLQREMVLGRTSDADLQLASDGVSRKHTRIIAADGAFWVNDLGSSNGTFVNGQRVDVAKLSPGDVIGVGEFRIEFRA